MKGRVERISPISPTHRTEFDIARSFEERRGAAGYGGGKSFQNLLSRAMQKRAASSSLQSEIAPSDAYSVNVTRATQSLFYRDGSMVGRISGLLHE